LQLLCIQHAFDMRQHGISPASDTDVAVI
jgi:hypothetical protein